MKNNILLLLLQLSFMTVAFSQDSLPGEQQRKDITSLIAEYSLAREKKDTTLLKTVLTADVDQLVSTGEWRNGLAVAVQGMIKSSASSPGTRTLTVDKIKMLNPAIAIADCRYEIQNANGTTRKMWSSFVVIKIQGSWKISAIRNMLPAAE